MIGIKGKIRVQTEDTHGNIKQFAEAENRLSEAALSAVFFSGMRYFNTNMTVAMGFDNTITTSQRFNLTLNSPQFGIYALDKEIDWSKLWLKPPYLKEDWVSVSDDVSFWHQHNENIETDRRMTRVITRAHFESCNNTLNAEWVKAAGDVGIVKSIAIGSVHGHLSPWGVGYTEPLPTHFFTGEGASGSYRPIVYEHLADKTIAYYGVTASFTHYFDFVTKSNHTYTGAGAATLGRNALAFTSGGTKWSFNAFTATGASSTAHNISFGTAANISTTLTNRTLVTPVGDVTLDTNRGAVPIVVMRPDTETVEIFLSLDYDENGCRLVKASIDAHNLVTAEPVWTEMGRIPFVLGGRPAPTDTANNHFGYYDVDKDEYWLPYVGTINDAGILIPVSGTTFTPGVKMQFGAPNSGGAMVGEYIAGIGASSENIYDIVKTSYGILQGRFRTPNRSSTLSEHIDYRCPGILFSAVNLPMPVTREDSDTLRLMYTYQLVNS